MGMAIRLSPAEKKQLENDLDLLCQYGKEEKAVLADRHCLFFIFILRF